MRQVYCCFFDDLTGLAARDVIGIDQITFETDYPHQDSTWPHTLDAVQAFADRLDDSELQKVLRGNAARLLGREG
jgi:predicted TIM-barrel fold metal-dependent hydrolase